MTDEQNLATEVKTGKIFKLARKELGLTRAEVSKATFMNMGYIDAIEKGDYTIFPSEGFAKAYFIKYQNFLSLECDFPPVYEDNNRQDEIIKKHISFFIFIICRLRNISGHFFSYFFTSNLSSNIFICLC